MNIEIANRLLQLRKEHKLSQEELAEKIGVSRQAISKWERAESSPDTDNLILLAEIYCITLDELIKGKSQTKESFYEEPQNDTENSNTEQYDNQNSENTDNNSQNHDRVSFKNGIHIEDKNGDRVSIDFNGIHVHDNSGTDVDIGGNRLYVTENNDSKKINNVWHKFPYPILCLVGFLAWGFLGGWYISWILFLTIPLYYTLVDSINKKNAKHFAYPVLVTIIFLFIGLQYSLWHPTWIIFITIPIYYGICELFK